MSYLWQQRSAVHLMLGSAVTALWGWGLVWWITTFLVRNYGMAQACRKVRAVDVAVLDLDKPEANVRGLLLRECREALDQDGIGAIVLGCAGMADLAHDLSLELGIPVIDGVAAAVRFAEALVGLGLKTSKHGDLAFPLPKTRTPI